MRQGKTGGGEVRGQRSPAPDMAEVRQTAIGSPVASRSSPPRANVKRDGQPGSFYQAKGVCQTEKATGEVRPPSDSEQEKRGRLSGSWREGTPARAEHVVQARRQRHEQQQAEGRPQPAAESPTRAHVTRRSRPRAHADMLAVVIGGHSPPGGVKSPEATGASLAKLLGDVVLVYAGETGGSYQPGTSLRQWSEHARRGEGADSMPELLFVYASYPGNGRCLPRCPSGRIMLRWPAGPRP
jgi:hypothetical protein